MRLMVREWFIVVAVSILIVALGIVGFTHRDLPKTTYERWAEAAVIMESEPEPEVKPRRLTVPKGGWFDWWEYEIHGHLYLHQKGGVPFHAAHCPCRSVEVEPGD